MPNSIPTLHLLASDSPDVLARCNAQAGDDDTLVLIADGVLLLAAHPNLQSMVSRLRIVCLDSDVGARGLEKYAKATGFPRVSESDVVDLIAQHSHCLTWK